MSLGHGASIVRSGLVLHLDAANVKSYPGSANTWFDLSGNGNDGTLVNGVTYDTDDNGALVFDRANNVYIDCGPVSAIGSSLTGLTVNLWINTSYKGTVLFAENGTNYTQNTFYFAQENANYFTFEVYGGGYDVVYANFIYQTGVWYNLTGVWSATNRVEMYSNGILCSGTRGGSARSSLRDGNTNLLLGTRNYGSLPFDGKMTSAQFYNRALTAAEIKQNFNAVRGRYGI